MIPLTCPCGAEAIPGALWTPEDGAAWERKHAGHGPSAPPDRPARLVGVLPTVEAWALRRALRDSYVVGVVEHPGALASVCVMPRGPRVASKR